MDNINLKATWTTLDPDPTDTLLDELSRKLKKSLDEEIYRTIFMPILRRYEYRKHTFITPTSNIMKPMKLGPHP
jgi:hypothetical protein